MANSGMLTGTCSDAFANAGEAERACTFWGRAAKCLFSAWGYPALLSCRAGNVARVPRECRGEHRAHGRVRRTLRRAAFLDAARARTAGPRTGRSRRTSRSCRGPRPRPCRSCRDVDAHPGKDVFDRALRDDVAKAAAHDLEVLLLEIWGWMVEPWKLAPSTTTVSPSLAMTELNSTGLGTRPVARPAYPQQTCSGVTSRSPWPMMRVGEVAGKPRLAFRGVCCRPSSVGRRHAAFRLAGYLDTVFWPNPQLLRYFWSTASLSAVLVEALRDS